MSTHRYHPQAHVTVITYPNIQASSGGDRRCPPSCRHQLRRALFAEAELALSVRNHIADSLLLGGVPLTVAEIADHFGVTADHLSRMHKKHYGQSLQAYLMRQRLDTAYRLLKEAGDGVSAVAYRLGFSDVQAFNKLFRKYFGVAPRAIISRSGL